MISKLFTFTVLITVSSLSWSQTVVTYIGQDLNKNFLVQDSGSLETSVLQLKKGQVLINNRRKGNDFVIAKNYEFVYNENEPLAEKITAFSIKQEFFPDTGTTFNTSSYTVSDTLLLDRLNEIESKKLYGDEAQIYLWKGATHTLGTEIYNWKQDFIYDSNLEGSMTLLGLVGGEVADTLYQKEVKQGSYKVDVKKIGFGELTGALSYQIIDRNGPRIITDPSRINKKDIELEIPFEADIPKICPGASLVLYDSNKKPVKTIFEKKFLKKGKFFERIKYNYNGFGDEQFTAILKNKKGEIVKETQVTENQINKAKIKNRGTVSYLNIQMKYKSKRPEKRTVCTIENNEGEILHEIYNNKNIHTGVNKVEYTYKHLLPEGQEITVYVKNRAGRVIAEQSYIIK